MSDSINQVFVLKMVPVTETLVLELEDQKVFVNGYYGSDGTYVRSHYRSSLNRTKLQSNIINRSSFIYLYIIN